MKTSRCAVCAAGLLAMGVLLGCCVPKASTEAEMLSFVFLDADNAGTWSADVTATIGTDGAVVAVVPAGTDPTNLVPAITVSERATVSPPSGEGQDFSDPLGVVYTVTAEDGVSYTAYTVTVTVSPPTGDTTAPVPGGAGALTLVVVTSGVASISWVPSADADAQDYKVVRSATDDIADPAVAEAKTGADLVLDWTSGVFAASATGLTPDAECWFNVLVRDEAGNVAAYEPGSRVMPPATARLAEGSWSTGGDAGLAVALSGDGRTMVIGAPGDATVYGKAYVYERVDGFWTSRATLTPSQTPDAGAQFGYAVAVDADGSTIVVGAPNTNSVETDEGFLLVYERPGDEWSNKTEDFAYYDSAVNYLGYSVAISSSGATVAAGAIGWLDLGTDQGSVVVVQRGSGTWIGTTATPGVHPVLTASDGVPGEYRYLGSSVAISSDLGTGDGTVVVAGAPGADGQGALYVFVRPGTTWTDAVETAKLARDALYAEAGDALGSSVAISADGKLVAAQAAGADSGAGAVIVYDRTAVAWLDHGGADDSVPRPSGLAAGDLLGSSLSFSSDASTLAVGAEGNDSEKGSVYLYSRSATVYSSAPTEYVAGGGAAGDRFGASVSLGATGSGAILAVGAPGGANGVPAETGAAFVLDL